MFRVITLTDHQASAFTKAKQSALCASKQTVYSYDPHQTASHELVDNDEFVRCATEWFREILIAELVK